MKYIYLFTFFLTVQAVYANSSPCAESFTETIDSFVENMTQNGHLGEHQHHLFQIYRANGFGNPKYNTRAYTMEHLLKILQLHPNKFSKIPIREQIIRFEQPSAEKDVNLKELLNQFKKVHLNLIQNLFQIEDHLNFWNHILDFRQPPSAVGLTKIQKRELKQQHHQEFLSYLNDFIDKENREFIANPSNHYKLIVIILYKTLEQIRERLKQSGKNIRPISQAMVHLIAGAGFLNQYYLDMLNSPKDAIEGVKRILQDREALAGDLGFNSRGFLELKNFLGVPDSVQDISSKIENAILTNQVQTLRLRALSLQESPFRSCLGGDCSTWMYFNLGLHSDFLFFTLTDEHNRSSGQITVVLGHAKDHTKNHVSTAFVDNIHNVPIEKIGPMLEGIRLSLSEYNYRLALSTLNEQVRKLSNEKVIRDYVNKEILPHLTSRLNQFKMHNPHLFKEEFYRNYGSIKMLEFEGLPVQNDRHFTITPGSKYLPNSIHDDLSLESFRQVFVELARSKTEEHQVKFLDNIPAFIHEPNTSTIIKDRLFNNVQSKEIAFSVRKRSLYELFRFFLYSETLEFWHSLFNNFTEKEKQEILGDLHKWKSILIEQLRKSDLPFSFLEFFIETFGMDIFRSAVIMNNIFYLERRDTLKLLMEKGLGVNTELDDGSKPIHISARWGKEKLAQLLIDSGADINAENAENSSPLHITVQYANATVAQLLIDNGANVNNSNDIVILTPLELAQALKRKKMIKLLKKAHIHDDKNSNDTFKNFIQKLIAVAIALS